MAGYVAIPAYWVAGTASDWISKSLAYAAAWRRSRRRPQDHAGNRTIWAVIERLGQQAVWQRSRRVVPRHDRDRAWPR